MSQPERAQCPDEAVLDAWATGSLQGEALKAANLHVSTCARCQQRLALSSSLGPTLTPTGDMAATLLRQEGEHSDPAAIAITEEAQGRYQILGELGRGGQSIVYLARDTHLDRDVALKVPRVDARGEVPREALAQFLREARITARLEHPNIVPIHEIGRRPDGTAYCTQRLVRGRGDGKVRTLAAALSSARTLEERLGLLSHLIDVCSAVAHAHLNGVIHRDLKPDNVVIGELGETVVLDWGIAKSPVEPEVSASVIGTPLYMSPEQARGELSAVDARSDVFSLGAMLYELLTGSPPFAAGEMGRVLELARAGNVRPVLSKERRAPRALAAVVERCLAAEPSRRYANAAEVGAELRAFLAHRPVRAYSYRAGELLRLFVERHKAVSAIAAISLVLLSALGVATFQNYRRARIYLSEALVEKARASEAALRWDEAAAYFAAARVEADTPQARYGAMLARARADTHLRKLTGHVGSVKALAVSRDQLRLASGGFDGTVRLWDGRTGTAVWSIDLGGGPISALEFAGDGRSLFAASEDNKVRRISVEGQIEEVVQQLAALGNSLSASRDGRWLAAAVEDNTVVVVDLTSKQARILQGHGNPVYAVAISEDGSLLASGSWDRTIRLWPLPALTEPQVLRGNEDSVLALAFTVDGKTLVSGSRDSSLRLWDVATGVMKERLAAHTQKVTAVAFSRSALRLASVSNDRTARLWAMQPIPRLLVGESLGLDEALTSVQFVGEDQLAFAGEDGALYLRAIVPAQQSELLPTLAYYPPSSDDLAFAGGLLLNTSTSSRLSERTFEARDPKTLQLLTAIPEMVWEGGRAVPSAPVHCFSVSGSGKLAAGKCGNFDCPTPGCTRHGLCVLELDTMRERPPIPINAFLSSTAISPDDRDIAVGTRDGTLMILDSRTNAFTRTFKDARTGIFSLAYSPDGKLLAAASYDRSLRLYETATWKMREVVAHEHGIRVVRFSPDSTLIASGGYDRVIRLWDAPTGREVAALKGHQEVIRSIAFSPDGALLASGAWDGTVRLWDVKTHEELARYVANDTRVYSVVFAPDGNALFYGGVRPYRLDFPRLLSPEEGLEQTLLQTGFELRGSALERRTQTSH